MKINERESSPAELAWNEFKNLISISIPKRIELIESKLQQNGQTIFTSEVMQEFNNLRTRLDSLQQQYQLTESLQRKSKICLSESKLRDIIKESVQNIVSEVSAAPNGFKHKPKKGYWEKDEPREYPEWDDAPSYDGKQSVKISEAQLHQIVKESVQRIMNEGWFGNLFKSQGQLDFERRRKEAQDAYNKQKAEDEKWHEKEVGQNTSVDNSDMNAYRIKYGTIAGYTPNWRERAQRENERQRKAYLNGRSHY